MALVPQGFGLLHRAHRCGERRAAAADPRSSAPGRASRGRTRPWSGPALPDHDDRLVEELRAASSNGCRWPAPLWCGAALLLADEPTSELDAVTRDLVLAALRAEAERGAVVVVATHDEEVAEQCDAVLHLVDGRVAPPGD